MGIVAMLTASAPAQPAYSALPQNLVRARVLMARDPQAVSLFEPVPARVKVMFDRALLALTEKTSVSMAWLSLVSTNDVIGIKVFSAPGPTSGTRPVVVEAALQGLLAAGIPATNIVIWDKTTADLRAAGFVKLANRYGVSAIGSEDFGYDGTVFYETPLIGYLRWGDFEFNSKKDNIGRKSYVSKLLTQKLTKIVNISPLLNHNQAGVSGNLFSLAMGSVDNTFRFEVEADRLARAVPEIYAMPQVGDRVVLNITDALICQYEGGEQSLLHYSTVLDELRFSRDPVALDVLSLDELAQQRQAAHVATVKENRELYSNASLLELGVSDPKKIATETAP